MGVEQADDQPKYMPPSGTGGGGSVPRYARLMREWHRMFAGVRYGGVEETGLTANVEPLVDVPVEGPEIVVFKAAAD